MTRTAIVTMLIGLMLAALAGPAVGQEPYPPPPKIKVSTPGATITVTGTGYGPGTTIEIETHNDNTQSSSAVTTSHATVGDDGTFEAQIAAPETPGDFQVRIAGTDALGVERSETRLFAVSSTANAADTLPATQERGGLTPLHILVAVTLVASAGLLIRRRVRA